MRIVHYISEIRREHGGTVRFVLDLCEALAGRGHEVTLLVWNRVDVPADWAGRDDAPRVVEMPRPHGPLQRLERGARRTAIESIGGADVLHMHVVWDPVCIRLSRIARGLGVPHLLTAHGMLDRWSMGHGTAKKRAYLAVGGRRMLEGAAAVHCASRGEADEAIEWFPRGRTAVIPLIVDVDPFRELPGPERAYQRWPAFAAGDPVVLFLGRLHEIKGLDLLVPMLARLHADGCRARLLLAGNDEQGLADGLYAEARAAGLEDAVTLLGFVDGPEKRSLLQAADVVVLPSRHESWGYALIEAMLCGTPVVTTRNVKSWVELEGSGGAIIAEATPEALAASVGDLLADDDRRELMGRAARRWCLEHLEPAVVVDAFERLYAGPGEASG